MIELRSDPVTAIDWLLDPTAADERMAWCTHGVLRGAQREIERLRELVKQWDMESLTQIVAERDQLRAEVEQQRLELGITGDACGALDSEVKQLRAEVLEQCRLNGMGGSREAKLLAENAQLRARVAKLEAALTDEVREHCAMRDAALEVGNVTLAGWHWARANVLNKATRTAPMKLCGPNDAP